MLISQNEMINDSNDSLTASLQLAIETISSKGNKRYCFCLYLLSPPIFPNIHVVFGSGICVRKVRPIHKFSLPRLTPCEVFHDFAAN